MYMDIKDFQKRCASIVRKIDNKYGVERSPQLSFVQLAEEVGELAKEVNRPMLRRQQIDTQDLKGEFADIFLQLSVLAELYNVDFQEAVEYKLQELQNRHGADIAS